MAQVLESLVPRRKNLTKFLLLIWGWSSFGYFGHLWSKSTDGIFIYLSAFQINKINVNFEKWKEYKLAQIWPPVYLIQGALSVKYYFLEGRYAHHYTTNAAESEVLLLNMKAFKLSQFLP